MNPKSTSQSRRLIAVCAAALLAGASLPAAAQQAAWPNKPVRLVVGFAPGGCTDVMARALAQSLTESLGQSFVVDNKPGASGNLSVVDVSKAAPDGYTLLVGPTSIETANPYLFKSPVNPSKDLTPVMGIGQMQMYVVAKPSIEAKNIKDLVALAKANAAR
jgi:tripartite-type tricarboxylate transporter receptor subunit TctC